MVDFYGKNYGAVKTADKFELFVKKLIKDDLPFGFDIESGYSGTERVIGTTGKLALMPFHPDWFLVGFSFTNSMEWARYVPIAHDTGGNVDDPVRVARLLWRLLATGKAIIHNVSFEFQATSRWFRDLLWDDEEVGEEVRATNGLFPFLSDTLIEAHEVGLYAPKKSGGPGLGLKDLTKYIFGHQMIEFDDLFPVEDSELGPGTKPTRMKYVRFNTRNLVDKVTIYACEDSLWCLAIHLHKEHQAFFKNKMRGFLHNVEMQLARVVAEMEQVGVYLDWETIDIRADEVKQFASLMNEEILEDISSRLGEIVNMNIGSSAQMQDLIYKRLGYPINPRHVSKQTGAPSADEKALRFIAKKDKTIARILEYREVTKLYGSYLNKYRTQLNYDGSGFARPNHNQVGTTTGRFSVDGLSYQQLPKPYQYELKDGHVFDLNFRNLLNSPPGKRMIGFDFSQVELRVVAGLAEEDAMLEAFANKVDIHTRTASRMLNIPESEVTPKIRAIGKTLNFAIVYGSGADNIAEMLSTPDDPVTVEMAEQYLEDYFAAFPKLSAWMNKRKLEGNSQHYVDSPFGRKIKIWEYSAPNKYIRSKGPRIAVNAPVQGGAADYMKIGMVRAQRAIKKAGLEKKIQLVLTIHDNLEFYVDNDIPAQFVVDLIHPEVTFKVPSIPMLPEIVADWHESRTWGAPVDFVLDDEYQITGYKYKNYAGDSFSFNTIEEAFAFQDANPEEQGLRFIEPSEEVEEETSVHEVEQIVDDAHEGVVDSVVVITQAPDEEQFQNFLEYIAKNVPEWSGSGNIVLETPDGIIEIGKGKLTQDDQAAVSLALGGAKITHKPREVVL